jgi:hypothetical protein
LISGSAFRYRTPVSGDRYGTGLVLEPSTNQDGGDNADADLGDHDGGANHKQPKVPWSCGHLDNDPVAAIDALEIGRYEGEAGDDRPQQGDHRRNPKKSRESTVDGP